MGELRESEKFLTVDRIMEYELDKMVAEYDNHLYASIKSKDYEKSVQYLTDFCFVLLDMTEEKQIFVARIFYVSVITDIIRIQNRKKRLHPRVLASSYDIITEIEKWENISEFILHTNWFIERIKDNILGDYLLSDGCKHVEAALQMINNHLEGNLLSVKWLADQLGITPTHLSNLFKLQLGETVAQYITKRKMNEIIFEITYTNTSVKEVREKYGYHNHSHFIQHFKKHHGITPLKFRQRLYRPLPT